MQVDFDRMKDRDNLLYRNVKCSETLFDQKKHLDLTHRK
jgi:hypothetical protein